VTLSEVVQDVVAAGRVESPVKPRPEGREIPAVGRQRVGRQPLLQPQAVDVGVDLREAVAIRSRVAGALARCQTFSLMRADRPDRSRR